MGAGVCRVILMDLNVVKRLPTTSNNSEFPRDGAEARATSAPGTSGDPDPVMPNLKLKISSE